jgi:hypothetical protein
LLFGLWRKGFGTAHRAGKETKDGLVFNII